MIAVKMTRRESTARPLDERTHRTTGINLPIEIWELLNRVAFVRAKKYGGRASVSALLLDLVRQHRKDLEKELQG